MSGSPEDMGDVARGVAEEVAGRGVDAVFVLCYRASDDSNGAVMHYPDVALDSMIGMVVAALGELRNRRAASLVATEAPPAPSR